MGRRLTKRRPMSMGIGGGVNLMNRNRAKFRRPAGWALLALAAFAAVPARAQDAGTAQPASGGPTSAPAEVKAPDVTPPDVTVHTSEIATPKAVSAVRPKLGPVEAYAEYNRIARSGDLKAMSEFYFCETEEEARGAKAIMEADVALARLAAATYEKFGQQARDRVQDAIGDARIEGMTAGIVTGNGLEVANLADARGTPVTTLILHDGKWRVFMAPAVKFWGGAEKLAEGAAPTKRRAEAVLAQLNEGRLKTADEVVAAVLIAK